MKTLLTTAAAILTLGVAAQSSIQLTDKTHSVVLAPKAIVDLETIPDDIKKITIDVKNTSGSTKSYRVTRFDEMLHSTSSAAASAFFCVAGTCYPADTDTSIGLLTLTPGESASQKSGDFQMIEADLYEAEKKGFSLVRYTVYNVDDANDFVQFWLRYNAVSPFVYSNPFTGVTISSGTSDTTTVPNSSGASFGPFTAVGVASNPSGNGQFGFSGWPTGAVDAVDTYSLFTGNLNTGSYYSVIVTPATGYLITISSVTFKSDRSATGPRSYAVRSSVDNYLTNLPASVSANTNLEVVSPDVFFWKSDNTTGLQSGNEITTGAAGFKNSAVPITFRFYSWNAEDAQGVFTIDDVTINGFALLTTGGVQLKQEITSSFRLFPNPSNNGIVNIQPVVKHHKVEVINMLGAIVHQQEAQSGTYRLNLETLPAGAYFVKVHGEHKVYSEKLIITK
jgi:hypothetical protein